MNVLFAAVLAATASPTPSPTPLPVITTVTVGTGSAEAMHRLPLPTALLTEQQLSNAPALTGDAVLRGLPGFDRDRSNSAFTNYGQLRVSIGGAGNDRALVLVDGTPVQDGFGGQIDWAAYPAVDLARAELLRGPASALYGTGAIGGVLSLSTFAPTARTAGAATGTIGFFGGSHGYTNLYAQSTTAISPRLAVSLSASHQHLAYADLPPASQSPIDRIADSRSAMSSLRLRYAASSSTSVEYGYRGAWDRQQEGRPNYDFWRKLAQQTLSVTHHWRSAQLTSMFFERNGFVTNRADRFTAPGTLLYTQEIPTDESGASVNWIVESAASTFEARVDGRFVHGVSDQYDAHAALTSFGSGVQRIGDAALQETVHFGRGEVVAGLGASSISLASGRIGSAGTVRSISPHTDRALSPRLALRYDLSPSLAFRASAGTGFRAPFLNELVRGYVIGPAFYLPNPNLVPERSSSLGAGFDWIRGGSELSVDAMRTFVSDAITFTTVDPTHQVRSNVGRTQTNGATLAYTRRVGACSSMSAWVNEQNARIVQGTSAQIGKQLAYVPKSSAFASFDSQVGAIEAGATFSYLGTAYADDLNTQPLGTAVTAGVHIGIPLRDGVRLVIQGENLTNARYRSSVDRYGPPAVISLGLQVPVHRAPPAACV